MKQNILLCKNHQQASLQAAALVAEAFTQNPTLTCTLAAGDTPLACYQELIRRQQAGSIQLQKARYIGLDEWLGLGPATPGSCLATMNRAFYQPAGIPQEQIAAFNGLTQDKEQERLRMEEILRQHPLDLAVLGVGVNGHIGFNEPGLSLTGDFALVPLSETTQQVGTKYFDGEATPLQGATMTLAALKKARRILIIATGKSKQAAAAAVLAGEEGLPVCAFLNHPGATYLLDEEAAGAQA